MTTGNISIPTVAIILTSKYFGQGRSVAMCSFARPGVPPKRLVMDFEHRDASYRSPRGNDEPEKLLYAFDLFGDVFKKFTLDSFINLHKQVVAGKFPYNFIGIDNATILQRNLLRFVQEQKDAERLARAFGVYAENRMFIGTRFRATDAGGIYTLIKSVIREFMASLREAKIDVVITAESHNVWENYGRKGAKILGQTAHLHKTWFQFVDLVYMLSRSKVGADQKRIVQGAPTAEADPFQPKHSVPGAPVRFELSTWKTFWKPVVERLLPTSEEWSEVVFPDAEVPEYAPVTIPGPVTLDEAKSLLADLAVKHGLMRAPKDGEYGRKMVAAAGTFGLTGANMLERYTDWVLYIEAQAEGKHTKEEFAAMLEADEKDDYPNIVELATQALNAKEATLKAEAEAAAAKALAAKKDASEATATAEAPWFEAHGQQFTAWAARKGLGMQQILAALSAAQGKGAEVKSVSATTLSHGEAKAAVDAYIAANLAEAKANLDDILTSAANTQEAAGPDEQGLYNPPF